MRATRPRLGLPGIPAAAETIMAERDCSRKSPAGGCRDMISAAETLGAQARRARGVNAVASVNVHHLVLNEYDVDGYRTFAKLSPAAQRGSPRAL